MRVGSTINFSEKTAKEIRDARANARSASKNKNSSSKQNSSVLTGKTSSSGTNTATGALYTAQLKKNYTAIKSAADGLQGHAEKLLDSGDDSLFAADKEDDSAKKTKTADRTALTKEIGLFLDDYNSMVSKMRGVDDSVNRLYLASMKNYTSKNKDDLKEVGITLKSDGTLSLKKSSLEKADEDKIKELFGTEKGFADKLSQLSVKIEENASTRMTEIAKNPGQSYIQYNSSGTGSTSSCGIFNTKG